MRLLVVGTHFGGVWMDAAKKNPHWEMPGVVARSEKSRIDAGKKYNIDPTYQFLDLDAALDKAPNLDAVVITTPNQFHYEMAQKVLDHNLHLIVEKPITDTWEQALDLVHRLDAHPGKKAIVGQTLRGDLMFRLMEYHLRKGIIGNIEQMMVNSHWYWAGKPEEHWRFTLRNMMLDDIGIHQFDAMRMLLGNLRCKEVFCSTSTPASYPLQTIKTTASGTLSFENNIMVNYFSSMASKGENIGWEGHFKIFGDKGTMVKDARGEPYFILEGSGKKIGLDSEYGDNIDEYLPLFNLNRMEFLLEDFYLAIKENRAPITDLHENLNSHAILLAMKKSADEKRIVDVKKEFLSRM